MSLACMSQFALAQTITLIEGPSPAQLTVRTIAPWTGVSHVLLQDATLTVIDKTARTRNDEAELRSVRPSMRHGMWRIERPDATRLFAYARPAFDDYGLLFVGSDGEARVVYHGSNEIEAPIAVSVSSDYAAFALESNELCIVNLSGSNFASTGQPWRVVTAATPTEVEDESVMVGHSHVFFVSDDNCVFRCGLADGNTPEDITPPTPGLEQDEELTMSGDGTAIAFLRGDTEWTLQVWFVRSSGAAQPLPMLPSEYREVGYLPEEIGHPRLLLNHSGSRLLVTDIQSEDEVFYLDTKHGDAALHVTKDETFSPYIGVHILPGFISDTLVMASGHNGWLDWYATHADGTVVNITETGSTESPFLVGALDVVSKYPLANNTMLATESIGSTSRLRMLDPAGATQILFNDLTSPPLVGSSFTGQADLRIVGQTGQRIVLGTNGSVRLSVPAAISLTDPVRSQKGWVATYAYIAGGFGVPVLMLPDGSNVIGTMGTTVPQLSFGRGGELHVLWPNELQVMSTAGTWSQSLPTSPIRAIVSGAGG